MHTQASPLALSPDASMDASNEHVPPFRHGHEMVDAVEEAVPEVIVVEVVVGVDDGVAVVPAAAIVVQVTLRVSQSMPS